MAGISKYTTDSLRQKLLHNATTSQYFLSINLPAAVRTHIAQQKGVAVDAGLQERINISCTDATLPGSSFATHDVTSDFMGVTEKMAYRRMYDDTMSVSMIVDPEYKTLHFFEGWMDYIAGKEITNRGSNENYKNFRNGFRMNYPDGDEIGEGYRSQNLIEIYKFERDISKNQSIKYTLIEGFPISMNPMDISYGSTDLLKLTVNFTFVRYVTEPYIPAAKKKTDEQSPLPTLDNFLLTQNFLNFKPGDGKINPELNFVNQNVA